MLLGKCQQGKKEIDKNWNGISQLSRKITAIEDGKGRLADDKEQKKMQDSTMTVGIHYFNTHNHALSTPLYMYIGENTSCS